MRNASNLAEGVGTGASLLLLLGVVLLVSRGRSASVGANVGARKLQEPRRPARAMQAPEPPANLLQLCREAGL
jgi:hypothetical protein